MERKKRKRWTPSSLGKIGMTFSDGNLLSTTDPDGHTIWTDYDALSRVKGISQSGSGAANKAAQFTYYADSQPETVMTFSGIFGLQVAQGTYGYDNDGRLQTLSYAHNGSPITTGSSAISYGLEYDAAGNITQVTSADGSDNYGLDSADQLTTASLSSESYFYDQNGNRTGGGYQTGADNRLLSDGTYTYQYDKNGNRTARFIDANHDGALDAGDTSITIYTWDYENRLTMEMDYASYSTYASGTSDQVVVYTYDFLGRMIRRARDQSCLVDLHLQRLRRPGRLPASQRRGRPGRFTRKRDDFAARSLRAGSESDHRHRQRRRQRPVGLGKLRGHDMRRVELKRDRR